MKIHLAARDTLPCLASALIDVWWLCDGTHCGEFMGDSVHAAAPPVCCRENKCPSFFRRHQCARHTPIHTLQGRPVLLTVCH